VDGYSGDAGDALAGHTVQTEILDGMMFSTVDSDNDINHANCASFSPRGGWWYASCAASMINMDDIGSWSLADPVVYDVQASRMLVKLN